MRATAMTPSTESLAHNGITIAGRSPTSVNASMGRRKDVVISGAGTTRPAPGPNRAEDLLGGVDGVARDRVDPAGDQCGSFGGVDGGAPGRRCRAAACPGRAFLGRTTSAGVLGTRTPLSPVRRRLILARTRPSSSPNAATRTTAMTTNIMSGFRSRETAGPGGFVLADAVSGWGRGPCLAGGSDEEQSAEALFDPRCREGRDGRVRRRFVCFATVFP